MEIVNEEFIEELLDEDDKQTEVDKTLKTDNEIEDAYKNISFRVVYQSNNFFLPQIRDLINGKEVINLRPEYQRRLRWSTKKKSLLIESLLLNIPIPPIFLYESDLARYEVMDGQQRLNAIHDFMENNFTLTGLEKISFLNGRRYNKLPPKVRRGLERASISAVVLLQETKSDQSDPYVVRRYVFERLNTGGENLNPQEIRNSIFRGPFNDLIVFLARNNNFCKIFGIPEYTETDESEYYENPDRKKNNLYSSMYDCQIVLRFFALLDDIYVRGSMRAILDNCMKRNKDISQINLDNYKTTFETLIKACDQIFDGQPFLLPPDEKGKRRVSIALFDACMVALYRRITSLTNFVEKRDQIRLAVDNALNTNLELLTGKSNTAQAIKDRIKAIGDILDHVA
ncbi:MAG: GmrSD restriction endonuclease domain-containing protein [Trichloromonadaceae bacterium]